MLINAASSLRYSPQKNYCGSFYVSPQLSLVTILKSPEKLVHSGSSPSVWPFTNQASSQKSAPGGGWGGQGSLEQSWLWRLVNRDMQESLIKIYIAEGSAVCNKYLKSTDHSCCWALGNHTAQQEQLFVFSELKGKLDNCRNLSL